MTGPGDEAGLSSYVIPEFQSQSKVPLQDDVGPASVIPGELVTVVRRHEPRRGRRRPAEAIGTQPRSGERLDTRPDREIADVVEGDELDSIVIRAERHGCLRARRQESLLKGEVVGTVRIARLDGVMRREAETRTSEETPCLGEGTRHSA